MNPFLDIKSLADIVSGWPLIIYVTGVSFFCTIVLRGIQFRSFVRAIRSIFGSSKKEESSQKDMSPIQAFINTLSSNLGNGSIAGTATAIYAGGPGAAFWILIFGLLTMSIRFLEVYASCLYGMKVKVGNLGGPMAYLSDVPGRSFLPFAYALLCFLFALVGGNSIQANSICVGIQATVSIHILIIASILAAFVLYVMCGGARRIVLVSEYLVPLKVIIFFGSALIVLGYHWAMIVPAIKLIIQSAFGVKSIAGALLGITIQRSIQFGMQRSIFETESGLGTAAIFFGSTSAQDTFESGLLGMMSTFVSSLVCSLVSLCIVTSGVWNSGLTSTALTIAAFQSVFGGYAGFIISFLAIIFGMGVIVAYAYIARSTWAYLTNGRFEAVCIFLYCGAAFLGALGKVDIVWAISDLITAGMLFINLYGLLVLLFKLRHQIINRMQQR